MRKRDFWSFLEILDHLEKVSDHHANEDLSEENPYFAFLLDHFDGPHFFLVTEHLWKTPEMEFSDRVDIVIKKIEKY